MGGCAESIQKARLRKDRHAGANPGDERAPAVQVFQPGYGVRVRLDDSVRIRTCGRNEDQVGVLDFREPFVWNDPHAP